MRKKLQGCIVMMTFYSAIIAQSNPTPFNLNTSGNYSFTSWASTSATGTYPANMFFHQMSATRPTITATAQSNLGAGFLYSNTDGTRIQGLDSDGILFQNKNLPVNTGYTANKMGEAVLGLVTTGREQIQVSWTAETKSSGANVTAMRLQYRIGSSGAYSDFSPISD
ncbi:MAG TPA: hypothetical protein VI731_06590, partial [Bacteroidia bacterium]|nr:hypothetical protein [Bacteroidia bacterium]